MTAHQKNMTGGSRTTELTVSAGLARGLLQLAVSKGADHDALLAHAGIDVAALEDVDNRVPFPKYVALMRAGQALADDPALALHYGETNDMARISVVGLIAYACKTMAEVMAQLNRYGKLVIEYDGPKDRFRLVQKDGGLWAVDQRANPNDFPELTESTFARMICGPRRFGVTQIATEVHVTHKAPPYRAEYERIFGAPVKFESEWNAVRIDTSWLSHPIGLEPRYAFGIFAERADALLKSLESSKTMRGRVEASLMPVLHTGSADIDTVAAKLGMSRSTLFNRLKDEGTNFTKVLDELRQRMALDYLGAKKVSVNETAYLVGFSEPAAFSRAFKRWTGKSPRDSQRTRRDRED
jgi:AraC-like DNA-binding protein